MLLPTPLEERSAKKPRLSIKIPQPANILLLNGTDDGDFKTQVSNRVQKTGFMDEIKVAFINNHRATGESIDIEKFGGEGANKNSHFIITHKGKEWHAKPALHGKNVSLGTPFNEFAHYKLNELLGIGPRCYGFVSKEVVVMILTEDLNDRSLNGGMNKKVSFSDNVNSEEKLKSIPNREQDSVHRCTAEIAINLLSLLDIKNNPGNTGIKSSKINDAEIKEKLFIVDFTLNSFIGEEPIDMKTYAESLARVLKPSSEPSSEKPLNEKPENQTIPKNIFKYKESPEVIGAALKKLFLDDDGEIIKFENYIKKAFEESKTLLNSYKIEFPKTGDTETAYVNFKEPHLNAITTQEVKLLKTLNTFLENEDIRTFLKEVGPKHK